VIVYGRNPVREALRGPRRVTRVWATREAERAALSDLVGPARGTQVAVGGVRGTDLPVESAFAEEIEALCGSREHQGICADAGEFRYADPEALLEPPDALVVCLDQVQDPQNLGAVCRVAECAGAAGVVMPDRRSARVSPAVCRASAGAVEHLPVARAGNLADFLLAARDRGAWCYGAAATGGTAYDEPDYRGRVVLVLGAEGRGLRPRVAQACDALISLPVRGRIESLNVATAGAALLYGILQSRGGS
jgi:23S rRNA (guanosine2251-2'-O)-methyltransferase